MIIQCKTTGGMLHNFGHRWMDSFITRYILFKLPSLKNVWNTMNNIKKKMQKWAFKLNNAPAASRKMAYEGCTLRVKQPWFNILSSTLSFTWHTRQTSNQII